MEIKTGFSPPGSVISMDIEMKKICGISRDIELQNLFSLCSFVSSVAYIRLYNEVG